MSTWKTIDEFPKYMVSDCGEVKTVSKDRILSPWKTNSGYLMVGLRDETGKKHNRYNHRLVAETFYDGDFTNLEVNHIDGDKLNNHLNNLEWCTHSENTKHAIKNGLFTPYRLPVNPRPKKKVKIIEIDTTFDSVTDCAKYLNTTKDNISKCIRGRSKTTCGYHIVEV